MTFTLWIVILYAVIINKQKSANKNQYNNAHKLWHYAKDQVPKTKRLLIEVQAP